MVEPHSSGRPLNRRRDLGTRSDNVYAFCLGPRRREGDRPSLVHDKGDELHLVTEFKCVLESISCPRRLRHKFISVSMLLVPHEFCSPGEAVLFERSRVGGSL